MPDVGCPIRPEFPAQCDHAALSRAGHEMMEGMIDLVTAHLKKGDRVRMSGLGILQVKDRPARLGRNPATGESIRIAASKKVAFSGVRRARQTFARGGGRNYTPSPQQPP
jgi:nucleoid DNA-binding protein